jgi:transcription elongation factor GreB
MATRVRNRCITPEGFARLKAEATHLWKVERPKVTQEVAAAAALGDRSENAEYIYGKKRLREIDRRVRHLLDLLDRLVVVHPGEVATDRVYFGAWVLLEDEEGEQVRYRLVGPDETAVERGWISVESPIGRVLVGRRQGDEVIVERPVGRTSFAILAISYQEESIDAV